MSQNVSTAVMQRRVEASDSLDFFPTPAWGTRALCQWLKYAGYATESLTCAEPACGQGHMSRPLQEYFKSVRSSDYHPYGFGTVEDFLFSTNERRFDWIITNPPFRLGKEFAQHGLLRADVGVALLVRTAFLESADRYRDLFEHDPPTDILQFVERLPMQKGIVNRSGSTATAYCWLVWQKSYEGSTARFHWLAPCRKFLEHDFDYPTESSPS